MPSDELVQIEFAFRGGDSLTARIPADHAESLEKRLRDREDAVVEIKAQDASYLVVLAQVLYVKRFGRESRVGFSTAP